MADRPPIRVVLQQRNTPADERLEIFSGVCGEEGGQPIPHFHKDRVDSGTVGNDVVSAPVSPPSSAGAHYLAWDY